MKRFARLFRLRWGPDVDEGVDWEIQHHIEERIDALMAAGASREGAEREAERLFGSRERVRRELRSIARGRARTSRLLDFARTGTQDVGYAFRSMRQSLGFTGAVVLTLGLGIGANTALYTVVDALLLRPLPYHAPEQLAQVELTRPGESFTNRYAGWTFASALRERGTFFGGVLVHTRTSLLYTGGSEPAIVPGTAVTADFHETLGVEPALGRGFLPEDARPGAAPTVLLGHGFWRRALAGSRSVLGEQILLDGVPRTIVGVMPEGFKFPEYSTTDAWVPVHDDGTVVGRAGRMFEMVARVPDGRYGAIGAQAAALGESLLAEKADELDVVLTPMEANRARGSGIRQALGLLAGAVALILLVAGVNMVNLLVVRATGRAREIAVRMALGGSRGRLVRQLMTEALVLSLLSGAAAVLLALLALAGMRHVMPDAIAFYSAYDFTLGARALLFTFVLAVLSGLLFGLLPSLTATRGAQPAAAAGLSVYAGTTRPRVRLRQALVVAEVALSVLLLAGAGLLVNSFVRLATVDPGFRPDGLAIMVAPMSGRPTQESAAHVRRVKERLLALPGVEGVSVGYGFPPGAGALSFGVRFELEGREPVEVGMLPSASVDEDFLAVSGARLISGRGFTEAELRDGGVAMIDEDLAAHVWPSEEAVGKRFRPQGATDWMTVVGVTRDLRLEGPDDREVRFSALYPLTPGTDGWLSFGIRTAGDPRPLLPAVRAAVREVAPDQPIQELAPADVLYANTFAMPRFLLLVMALLAGIAVTLAAVGIFGVLSFGVTQRTRELGIRLALGARTSDVRRLVLREGLLLALTGCLLGLVGAVALGRFLAAWLYGLEPSDPLTLSLVVVAMLATALMACVQPARRATGTDPVRVLRAD